MISPLQYLAFDLGASSGRAMLGSFDGARVTLRELHRFPNGPITRPEGLYWDAPALLTHLKHALKLCSRDGITLAGIGIDTWGVDYALLSSSGDLLGLPRHYRDPRTRGLIEAACTRVPRRDIYSTTGIQFMELNTLFQLLADAKADPGRLASASTLLFMPNLLSYWLTGVKIAEESIASTSQIFDPQKRAWATELVNRFGLPATIFPAVQPSGTVVGPLLASIAAEVGLPRVPVIAPACHDTASAVAAVPAAGEGWAYISCGTWSLVGAELEAPIRTPAAMEANFTNELGVGGTVRFLKNIPGLWLLQECQRVWESQGRHYTHDQLDAMARQAPALQCLIDPDDATLTGFGDMPANIRALATRCGPAPADDAQIVRCILESLAIKHRLVIDELERLTSRTLHTIHLVGGGSRNTLLCEFTAEATGRRVIAGPVEATALGNTLVQAMAQGHLDSRHSVRTAVASSFSPTVYIAHQASRWEDAIGRMRNGPAT